MAASLNRIMEQFGTHSLGIEVTDRHVKWLELAVKRNGRARLKTLDLEPLPAGVIEEGKIVLPTALLQALQALVQRNGKRKRLVHFVLPSSLTMVRFLKLPDVRLKDLKKIIDLELKYNIPLPFDNPYYDFVKSAPETGASGQEATPAGMERMGSSTELWPDNASTAWNPGTDEAAAATEPKAPAKQCEVMLVAAPLQTIEQYAELLKNVGLKPASVEIKALSLYRIVESVKPIDPQSTFVMVDITSTYADVSIYRRGEVKLTRNKPIQFPPSSDSRPEYEFEFQTACQDLASELDRFVTFYQYSLNNREQTIEALLVTGDVDHMEGIVGYLSQRLPYEVIPLPLDSVVTFAGPGRQLERFAAPLGLALRGRQP